MSDSEDKGEPNPTWTPRAVSDARIGVLAEDRYRVLFRLGEGGMGIVYAAENIRIKRKVALKALQTPLASNQAAVERFQREAFAATAIGDRHIVEVFDMGHFEDGTPFIVMELLEGESLHVLLQREAPLSLARVTQLLAPLCRALSRAHDAGIIHRDIKPQNLMLCRMGDEEVLKILDFGISKIQHRQGDAVTAMTAEGQGLGTPAFMAPEQFGNAVSVDSRADVFSLGVLLFQMLTRELPFAGCHPLQRWQATSESPAEALRRARPDLPSNLRELVTSMLAREPSERPQSCLSVLATFQAEALEYSDAGRPKPHLMGEPLRSASDDRTQPTVANFEANLRSDSLAAPVHSKVVSGRILGIAALLLVLLAGLTVWVRATTTAPPSTSGAAPPPQKRHTSPTPQATAKGPAAGAVAPSVTTQAPVPSKPAAPPPLPSDLSEAKANKSQPTRRTSRVDTAQKAPEPSAQPAVQTSPPLPDAQPATPSARQAPEAEPETKPLRKRLIPIDL